MAAIAAAAFGRLSSIPLALLGGILLGVAQGCSPATCPTGSVLSPGAAARRCRSSRSSCCCSSGPGCGSRREVSRPAGGRRPAAAGPGRHARPQPTVFTGPHRVPSRSPSSASAALCLFVFDGYWLNRFTLGRRVRPDLPVDHRHHRDGRPGLAVPGGVRGHRRVHHRAARRPLRHARAHHAGRRRRARRPLVGALLAIPALRLGGIYLVAGHPGVRAHVRERARPPRLGERRRTPLARAPARSSGPSTSPATRPSSSSASCLLAVVAVLVIFVRKAPPGATSTPSGAARSRPPPSASTRRGHDHRVRALRRHRRARRRAARHRRPGRRTPTPVLALHRAVLGRARR